MQEFSKYSARIAKSNDDVRAAQAFRAQRFGLNTQAVQLDIDIYDAHSKHVLIEDLETGELQACFRFIHSQTTQDLDVSYSSQFYNLERLADFGQPVLEIGRFCIAQGLHDAEIIRVAWGFLTRYVDLHGISMMMGCSSFVGTDYSKYVDAFALLKERHLAPTEMRPLQKADEIYDYSRSLANYLPYLKNANQTMPPLLRTYLAMGGWVSDHAVIDRKMNTLHVFTGIEIAKIPNVRARLLREDAYGLQRSA